MRKSRLDYQIFVEQEKIYNDGVSLLNTRFIDLKMLFTHEDLNMIKSVINELKAYAFYNVLPDNIEDFKNYINHNVHIIPRKDLTDILNLNHHGFGFSTKLDIEIMFEDGTEVISDLKVEEDAAERERLRLEEEVRQGKMAGLKTEIEAEKVRKADYLERKRQLAEGLIEENPEGTEGNPELQQNIPALNVIPNPVVDDKPADGEEVQKSERTVQYDEDGNVIEGTAKGSETERKVQEVAVED